MDNRLGKSSYRQWRIQEGTGGTCPPPRKQRVEEEKGRTGEKGGEKERKGERKGRGKRKKEGEKREGKKRELGEEKRRGKR